MIDKLNNSSPCSKSWLRATSSKNISVLSPLLSLLVMSIILNRFFGRDMDHHTTYLFCGNLLFAHFQESTTDGMNPLIPNTHIFFKTNIPKYLFLLSKHTSVLINFALTPCVFFLFALIDGVRPGVHMLALVYPVCCLVLFNIGMGLIITALFIFFRDII